MIYRDEASQLDHSDFVQAYSGGTGKKARPLACEARIHSAFQVVALVSQPASDLAGRRRESFSYEGYGMRIPTLSSTQTKKQGRIETSL